MSNEKNTEGSALVLPPFGGSKDPMVLDLSKIREAESRIIEAKTVNPMTYVDLEHSFNEAYRDLKRHLSTVAFAIALAEKAMEEAKANILLDKYPTYLETSKVKDNADIRKAFMIRDKEYTDALDRINQLRAVESNFDGKIKVMERTCAYMKKEIDLLLRSGLTGRDMYNTQGKK